MWPQADSNHAFMVLDIQCLCEIVTTAVIIRLGIVGVGIGDGAATMGILLVGCYKFCL